MNIKAIVTDIEGTTTSISFVHDVLFPYSSRVLEEFLRDHHNEASIVELLQGVRELADEPGASVARIGRILLQWIEEDRKATPLKALQGFIWEHGYKNGTLRGHLYPDVVNNLQAWTRLGIDLYVYSSGSVKAQQLLFGYSEFGDIRGYFKDYFDTRIGLKQDVGSYQNIVEQLAMAANQILFLSDVLEELDAASQAGIQVIQLVREPNVVTGRFPIVANFDQIEL